MAEEPSVISLRGPYAHFEATCRAGRLKPVLGLALRTGEDGAREAHVVLLDGALKPEDILKLFRRMVALVEAAQVPGTEEGGSDV